MQGWRNTMEDSHITKILDETPGKQSIDSLVALIRSRIECLTVVWLIS